MRMTMTMTVTVTVTVTSPNTQSESQKLASVEGGCSGAVTSYIRVPPFILTLECPWNIIPCSSGGIATDTKSQLYMFVHSSVGACHPWASHFSLLPSEILSFRLGKLHAQTIARTFKYGTVYRTGEGSLFRKRRTAKEQRRNCYHRTYSITKYPTQRIQV
jgi:hypothetical protein